MKNPIFNKQHLREYFLYGFICALLYILPILFFLKNNLYQNLYYLYIGNALFMFVIFFYAYKLLSRPYDSKRSVSMMIAGTLATITGVAISVIFIIAAMFAFFPDLFNYHASGAIIKNAPASVHHNYPTGLLLMLFFNVIFCNFGCGAIATILTAYAAKKEQRKDKPADLTVDLPERNFQH